MHSGEQSDHMNLLGNDGLDTPMAYQPERLSNHQRPLFLQNINKARTRPNDHLTWSIINAFCCMLGFIPLIYSLKSRDSYYMGDYIKAKSAAKCAKVLNIVLLTMSLLIPVIFLGFMGLVVLANKAPTSTSQNYTSSINQQQF